MSVSMLSLKKAIKWAYQDISLDGSNCGEVVYRITFSHELPCGLLFHVDYHLLDGRLSFSIGE